MDEIYKNLKDYFIAAFGENEVEKCYEKIKNMILCPEIKELVRPAS